MSCLVLSMLTHFLITQPAPPIMRGMDSNYSCITFHFPFQIWCSTDFRLGGKPLKCQQMTSTWSADNCDYGDEVLTVMGITSEMSTMMVLSVVLVTWPGCCSRCCWCPRAGDSGASGPHGQSAPLVLISVQVFGFFVSGKIIFNKSFSEENELLADRTQANGPTPENSEEHNRTR